MPSYSGQVLVADTAHRNSAAIPSPSQALRDVIDLAVHATVSSISGAPGANLGQCPSYAIVGAMLLSTIFDYRYDPVAGGEIIDCGNGIFLSLFPPRAHRRRAQTLTELREYHCWIEARPARKAHQEATLEIIDFTTRHDRAVAEMFGVNFTKQDGVDYLWGNYLELKSLISPAVWPHLHGKRRQWLWVDAHCTKLLLRHQQDNLNFYTHLVSTALVLVLEQANAGLVEILPHEWEQLNRLK